MAEEHLLIKNSECSRYSQNKLVLVKTAALLGLSIVLDATTDLDIECCLARLQSQKISSMRIHVGLEIE